MKELKVSGTIKYLDDLLWVCQNFDIEDARDDKVTFSGKVEVVGDWQMVRMEVK